MAVDIYNKRQMYEGPFKFLIIIPIGAIICFLMCDFVFKIYQNIHYNAVCKEIFTLAMDEASIDDVEHMKIFMQSKFEDAGYETDDLSLSYINDYYIMFNYHRYINVIGSVTFGLIRPKYDVVSSQLKGHYNEYKETVIEKYDDSDDEYFEVLRDEDGNPIDTDIDDTIIIE